MKNLVLMGVLHAKRFKCNVKVGDVSVGEVEGCGNAWEQG